MQEFENLFAILGEIQEHLFENTTYYGVGVFFLIPTIIITRKYSLPLLFYITETIIYFFLMHTTVSMVTNFFTWLHNNTSMSAVGDRRASVEWDTPWAYFWRREEYNPEWLFFMEAVFAVIIMILVIKYRPIKIQKARQQTEAAKKGEFNPDGYSSRARAQDMARKYSNPQGGAKGGKGRH